MYRMPELRHIMVAADIRDPKGLEHARHVLDQAMALAVPRETRLSLIHVVQAGKKVKKAMLEETDSPPGQEYQAIQMQLSALQDLAEKQGIETTSSILFGKAWLTLIQEVLRTKPDLLLAGPAHRGPVTEALFGSTTMKLLRKCPCPVWVTKPREKSAVRNILVAHDLNAVGSACLEWAAELARRERSKIHVLHCMEPEDYFGFMASTPNTVIEKERASLTARLQDELSRYDLAEPAELTVRLGPPQVEIYNYLNEHSIDLLIMGTLARVGVSAVITGNTAETLLPWIRCSLMALKPDSFVSSVPSPAK